ncbi:MAG: hypothetical protein QM635_09670 [Microbacteriaceae bacterium]
MTRDGDDSARLLAGNWRVAASSFLPHSVAASPVLVEFEPLSAGGRLRETWRFRDERGRERTVRDVNRLRGQEFVRRSSRRLGALRWRFEGLSEDGLVAVLGQRCARAAADDAHVLVRVGASVDARTIVATQAARFGLGPERFASLSWYIA